MDRETARDNLVYERDPWSWRCSRYMRGTVSATDEATVMIREKCGCQVHGLYQWSFDSLGV